MRSPPVVSVAAVDEEAPAAFCVAAASVSGRSEGPPGFRAIVAVMAHIRVKFQCAQTSGNICFDVVYAVQALMVEGTQVAAMEFMEAIDSEETGLR